MPSNPTTPNFEWNANRQIATVNGQLLMGGIIGPFFAPLGSGTIYFDASANRFKASENGGSPVNLLTGGGGGGAYTNMQANGTPLPQEDTLNLVGNALSGSDVPGVKTNITLSQTPVGSTSVVGSGRDIATTAPLTGGGTLTSDLSLGITQATTSTNGYLSSTDWNTFNNKASGSDTISTTAPLTGGGAINTNPTIAITQATTSTNGFLTDTDWNTFNSKISVIGVYQNGTLESSRPSINFIPGTNISSITVADNPGANRADVTINATGGGGAVSSVSNSDGSLTVSPTTGAVVASLNVAHGNSWTGEQKFAASGTANAGINLGPLGTAPTSPVTGDLYAVAGPHLYYYEGGTAYDLLAAAAANPTVHNAAGQQSTGGMVISTSTITPVLFSPQWDTSGDGFFTVASSTITFTLPGIYQVNYNLDYQPVAASGTLQALWQGLTGTATIATPTNFQTSLTSASLTEHNVQGFSFMFKVNTAATFQLSIYQDSGSNVTLNTSAVTVAKMS